MRWEFNGMGYKLPLILNIYEVNIPLLWLVIGDGDIVNRTSFPKKNWGTRKPHVTRIVSS